MQLKEAPDSFPKAGHKGPSTGQSSSTEGIFWSKREEAKGSSLLILGKTMPVGPGQ